MEIKGRSKLNGFQNDQKEIIKHNGGWDGILTLMRISSLSTNEILNREREKKKRRMKEASSIIRNRGRFGVLIVCKRV